MLKRKTPTPAALAEQLNAAQIQREAVISRANAEFRDVRDGVIATTHEQIDNIVQMREELEREQAALEVTLEQARGL